MKQLKLETIISLLDEQENTLSVNGINNFLEALVLDSLQSNDVDPMEFFSTTERDFIEQSSSMLPGLTFDVELTNDSCLSVSFNAYCDFERELYDETDNGGGVKGSICGVENSWIEILTIAYFSSEGSVIDFTENKEIKLLINEAIKIQ